MRDIRYRYLCERCTRYLVQEASILCDIEWLREYAARNVRRLELLGVGQIGEESFSQKSWVAGGLCGEIEGCPVIEDFVWSVVRDLWR